MYETELSFLKDTFFEAWKRFGNSISEVLNKGEFDRVTDIDRSIEIFVTERIRDAYPNDRIHSEEYHSDVALAGRTWILDPIDGTYNFSTGSPHFSLQGALWIDGETKLAVIYQPKLNDTYEAIVRQGAYCNGKRIHVSSREPKESIFSFGDLPHHNEENRRNYHSVFTQVRPQTARLRFFGAASVDFSYLASGKTEGVVIFSKKLYDLVPGILLAAEAGAVITDPFGNPYHIDSIGVIAANCSELNKIAKLKEL